MDSLARLRQLQKSIKSKVPNGEHTAYCGTSAELLMHHLGCMDHRVGAAEDAWRHIAYSNLAWGRRAIKVPSWACKCREVVWSPSA